MQQLDHRVGHRHCVDRQSQVDVRRGVNMAQPAQTLPAVAAVDARLHAQLRQLGAQIEPVGARAAWQMVGQRRRQREIIDAQDIGQRHFQHEPAPAPLRRRRQTKREPAGRRVGALAGHDQRQAVDGPMRQAGTRLRVPLAGQHVGPAGRAKPHQAMAVQLGHVAPRGVKHRRHHSASSTRCVTRAARPRPPRSAPSAARRSPVCAACNASPKAARKPARRSPLHSARTPPMAT